MSHHYIAYRAARLVPWLDPARGREIHNAIKVLDNAVLLTCDGKILAVGRRLSLPSGCVIRDLGPVTIAPPLVNCHTHLQLSWLKGKTRFGAGFTNWLRSLAPHILAFLANGPGPDFRPAISRACAELTDSGCGFAGDIGGSLPGALSVTDNSASHAGLTIRHFCEWFGFGAPGIWPERCRDEIAADGALAAKCSPAGHALYSTSPEQLVKSHAWCSQTGRKFSFHLAESSEEQELLLTGAGPLADFYKPAVLPQGWRPPGLTPYRLAEKLGILTANTIAVHGVWLQPDEIRDLAATGTALCLCPRSNRNIGSGTAPVRSLANAGVFLCLGTDGLTSSENLDLRMDAAILREQLSPQAVLRIACANGAQALGLPSQGLQPGAPAKFSLWEDGLLQPEQI